MVTAVLVVDDIVVEAVAGVGVVVEVVAGADVVVDDEDELAAPATAATLTDSAGATARAIAMSGRDLTSQRG